MTACPRCGPPTRRLVWLPCGNSLSNEMHPRARGCGGGVEIARCTVALRDTSAESRRRTHGPVCRPSRLLDRNPMDALSDVLKSVRLEGAVFLNAEFTAPWCIRGRYGLTSVRERLAGTDHVVFFHFLT